MFIKLIRRLNLVDCPGCLLEGKPPLPILFACKKANLRSGKGLYIEFDSYNEDYF